MWWTFWVVWRPLSSSGWQCYGTGQPNRWEGSPSAEADCDTPKSSPGTAGRNTEPAALSCNNTCSQTRNHIDRISLDMTCVELHWNLQCVTCLHWQAQSSAHWPETAQIQSLSLEQRHWRPVDAQTILYVIVTKLSPLKSGSLTCSRSFITVKGGFAKTLHFPCTMNTNTIRDKSFCHF